MGRTWQEPSENLLSTLRKQQMEKFIPIFLNIMNSSSTCELNSSQKNTLLLQNKIMKKSYRLCSCWTPLIFTFAFPYKEWYCLNCWNAHEFLRAWREEKSDREIQMQWDLVHLIFNRIRKDLQSPWCTHSNCKKCEWHWWTDKYHILHLTKMEKEKDIIARKYLEKFIWIFN